MIIRGGENIYPREIEEERPAHGERVATDCPRSSRSGQGAVANASEPVLSFRDVTSALPSGSRHPNSEEISMKRSMALATTAVATTAALLAPNAAEAAGDAI
jgi:acyl-CoA synthetase (AMP-forming)/AMP-acid ligase II